MISMVAIPASLEADATQIGVFCEGVFRHATPGTRVSLRAFADDKSNKVFRIENALVQASGPEALVAQATEFATAAAQSDRPVVFCPPLATFRPETERAGVAELAEGLCLSVEIDRSPEAAAGQLQELLGPATLVVESGGQWVDPVSGEIEPKLHLHWRLATPTRTESEHKRLKHARTLATRLIGGDASAVPIVHPMRWPGSWHRKVAPVLARIGSVRLEAEIDLADALERLRGAVDTADGATGADGSAESSAKPDLLLRASTDRDVAAALAVIPNPELPWDEWNRIGMAAWAATAGSETGLRAFLDWSSKSSKFEEADARARWEHYRTSPPSAIGAGTLFWEASYADPNWREAAGLGPELAAAAEGTQVYPVDLWGRFPPPDLPVGLLPPVLEELARVQGALMGVDPGGLATSALAVCAAAIPDSITLRMKRHDPSWVESARIWVVLAGEPAIKKTPIIRVAAGPLAALDVKLARQHYADLAKHEALPKEERPKSPPKRSQLRVEDTTTEAVQETMRDNTEGLLCLQDELSGFFGRMEAYSGAKGASKDRSFWLQSFNGGNYPVQRIGRGSFLIENNSISLLGCIQPDAIRRVAADSVDDGLLQRFFPIVLQTSSVGKDEPAPPVLEWYRELVNALVELRQRVRAGLCTLELVFDDGANAIRRELEERHFNLAKLQTFNRKLAAHIGKLDGLFGRLCIIWHCVEHAHAAILPAMISAHTARRVAKFLHGYLLRHAIAFYSGTLGVAQDHDQLADIANHILVHRLKVVTSRDVARGTRQMKRLRGLEIRGACEQLRSRPGAAPKWMVNPLVHTVFADRAEAISKERREAHLAMKALKRS
jgi:hypothetical protein